MSASTAAADESLITKQDWHQDRDHVIAILNNDSSSDPDPNRNRHLVDINLFALMMVAEMAAARGGVVGVMAARVRVRVRVRIRVRFRLLITVVCY